MLANTSPLPGASTHRLAAWEDAAHGQPRPALGPRRVVPLPPAPWRAHARGPRAGLRRRGAALRGVRRAPGGAAAPRPALPTEAGVVAARAGAACLDRR